MVGRNLIIILIDGILGALVGLELRFSLLGKLFIEPYRSLMPAFWGVLFLLWLLVQIPVTRQWWWSALGAVVGLLVAGAIPIAQKFPSLDWLRLLPSLISLALLLLAVLFAGIPVQTSYRLASYLTIVKTRKITVRSYAGPYWLIFSVVLGVILGVAIYQSWIPASYSSFLTSPELFRLMLYVFFASLSGYISVSAGWGAFSAGLFVFFSEFTFQFLYTAYTSWQQLLWEVGGIFVDPSRFSAPLVFVIIAFLWGWLSGHYSRLALVLKEARVEPKKELELAPAQEKISPETEGTEEQRKSCGSCGASIRTDAAFCPFCGAKQDI